MSYHENDLEVIVLGGRATGKTSLLSSMFMQMETQLVTSCNGMTFSTIGEEFNFMKDNWFNYLKIIRDCEFSSSVPNDPNNWGTMPPFVDHDFVFKASEKEQIIRFVESKIRDDNAGYSALIRRINDSFLTMCVVDAAVLMECDDIVNERWNCPMAIKQILKNVLDDGDKKKPISCMFILTKCEKYMHTPEGRDRLAERFEQVFKPVLEYAAEKRFPLFYLPVQTMGCIEFSQIDSTTKEMIFKTVSKELQPVDVIFPMVYALKTFLLNMYIMEDTKPWWKEFFDGIRGVEINYHHYYNALLNKVDEPTDFRGNRFGTSPSIKPMDFWKDFPGN